MATGARRRGDQPPWAWRLVLGFVVWVMKHVYGWRVRAQRPEVLPPPEKPLVVVFNHTSNVDAFLVVDTVWRGLGHWCHPLAKAELFDVPVFGRMARAAGAIPVPRGQDAGREAAYGEAVGRLHAGGTLLIAPEGTITHDGSLLPLRHGAARLALQAGVDVLAVTHFGAQRGFSPVVRSAERDVVVTMAFDVISPWADDDAASLTGRIAATMIDRSAQLQAAYPQADPDAAWWPPYSVPASPTATARANLEQYRESMAEAVAHARERMARFAHEHHVDERVAQARAAAEDLAERSRRRAELLQDVARERAHDLGETARERAHDLGETARERAHELGERARERAAEHGWHVGGDDEASDREDADEPTGRG